MPLLIVDAVFALAAAVALSVTLRPAEATRSTVRLAQLRIVWRLAAVAFLGFGVFVALTTWLQALLEPAGISDTTAGWLLAAMVVAGVAGSAYLRPSSSSTTKSEPFCAPRRSSPPPAASRSRSHRTRRSWP